ncbi:MAG: hypothetical protein ACJ0FM_03990 [Gammaproteobacteria bacterium]
MKNGSIYLGGTYNFDNGMEFTADLHYWETEADNVYYPYFCSTKLWTLDIS